MTKRVLALLHTVKISRRLLKYVHGYMNGATRRQHAVNFLAIFNRIGRLMTFMFEGDPTFDKRCAVAYKVVASCFKMPSRAVVEDVHL